MTPRITAGLTAAAAVMLAVLVAKVMAVSIMAGTLLVCVLAVTIGSYVVYRLIATGPGRRCAGRELTAEDKDDIKWLADVRKAVISRPETENEPPWEPAPVWDDEPQTVIEPAAVTHGPPQPEPDAYWIAAGTYSAGQVRLERVAVLPPLQCPALPQWVTDILGADSVDGAMREICGVVHSWESNYTKGDARYLRALTDGAP